MTVRAPIGPIARLALLGAIGVAALPAQHTITLMEQGSPVVILDGAVLLSGLRDPGTTNESCLAFEGFGLPPSPGTDPYGKVEAPGPVWCPSGVVGFAKNHRPRYVDGSAWREEPVGSGNWVVALALEPSRTLPLALRSVGDAGNAPAHALTATENTFETYMVGFALEYPADPITAAPIVTVLPATGSPGSLLLNGCNNIREIRADPALYTPGKLNIYFVNQPIPVPGYPSPFARAFGESCATYGAPELIFVNYGASGGSWFILAHEIGHSLGFLEPFTGHVALQCPSAWDRLLLKTSYACPFDATMDWHGNLMWGGDWSANSNGTPNDIIDDLSGTVTLGQTFRMHFGTASWVNLPVPPTADECLTLTPMVVNEATTPGLGGTATPIGVWGPGPCSPQSLPGRRGIVCQVDLAANEVWVPCPRLSRRVP